MVNDTLLLSTAALLGLCVVAVSLLKAWQGWLSLRLREIDLPNARGSAHERGGSPSGMARIEIADLKERIRRLEAIAAGVDL